MTPSFRSVEQHGLLRVEELAHDALIGRRLLLDRAVVGVVEASPEAVPAEAEGPSQALGGLRMDRAFGQQLLESCERRLGRLDPRLGVLAVRALRRR